jgi:hypothetical protein
MSPITEILLLILSHFFTGFTAAFLTYGLFLLPRRRREMEFMEMDHEMSVIDVGYTPPSNASTGFDPVAPPSNTSAGPYPVALPPPAYLY